MDKLLNVLKTIALDAVENTKPTIWIYGNVTATNPLNVRVDTKLNIASDFIEFGSRDTSNIEIGDRLILLRQQGGQLFLCLDVIKGGV